MGSLNLSRGTRIAAVIVVLGAFAGACADTGSDTNMQPIVGGPGHDAGSFAGTDSGVATLGGTIGGTIGGTLAGTIGGTIGGPGGLAGGASDAGIVTGGAKLPCAVQQIVDSRCGTCHGATPSFSAPMSLTTYAQFQAAGVSDKTKKVYQLVKTRINSATVSVKMPPSTSTPLSATELSTMNAWLDGGALPGTDNCTTMPTPDAGTGPVGGPADKTGLDCYKFTAHAQGNKNAKYPVGAATDQYLAFGFAAPWQGTVYGEVFEPIIDNTTAIHHWLLYEEPNTDGDISTTIGQHPSGNLLAGWAPGGQTYDFRKHGDVGYELNAQSFTLEIHYNSTNASNADASGVEICVQKTKPQNVAGMTWLGWDNLVVPSTTWTGTCSPAASQPIHILFVTPHLHVSGTHLKATIDGPSGSRTLLDEPFDFQYQRTYEKTETLMPGESITTTCTYNQPQTFGQATTAEMCYLFTYSYPKGLLADDSAWGVFAHGGGTCLGEDVPF